MKHLEYQLQPSTRIGQYIQFFICLSVLLSLISCATIDPAKVDVQLKETAPEIKNTSYTQVLLNLGLMTEIYGTGSLKIQSNPIGDDTGTSGATGGEIPRDITEMIKSSLNAIGGKVVFIPYDPAFIQNQIVTGYSNFDQKTIPDVVITGGITEFDRGLETRGKNTDAGAEANFTNAPGWVPSKTVGIDYGQGSKSGLARITLDFNLIDFKTMTGISRMNTVNSMEVTKALSEKELGITLFGPTFGRKGSIKKVQGRHAAVRLLVEVSMIQIVGKYLNLPYWRLIGEDAAPDNIVMREVSKGFYSLSAVEKIAKVQEWLFLSGHEVPLNGRMDDKTEAALKSINSSFVAGSGGIDLDTYTHLYLNIPIEEKTFHRRSILLSSNPNSESYTRPRENHVMNEKRAESTSTTQAVSHDRQEPKTSVTINGGAVGRRLSDEEW